MIVNCDKCGKEIDRKPSWVKMNQDKGQKTYCSNECRKLGQFKGEICKCGYCGKEIYNFTIL